MMKSAGMAIAMAMMGIGMMNQPDTKETKTSLSKEEIDEAIERDKRLYKELLVKKGIKKFVIDGHEVYARDLKNAQRKANNPKKKS